MSESALDREIELDCTQHQQPAIFSRQLIKNYAWKSEQLTWCSVKASTEAQLLSVKNGKSINRQPQANISCVGESTGAYHDNEYQEMGWHQANDHELGFYQKSKLY